MLVLGQEQHSNLRQAHLAVVEIVEEHYSEALLWDVVEASSKCAVVAVADTADRARSSVEGCLKWWCGGVELGSVVIAGLVIDIAVEVTDSPFDAAQVGSGVDHIQSVDVLEDSLDNHTMTALIVAPVAHKSVYRGHVVARLRTQVS